MGWDNSSMERNLSGLCDGQWRYARMIPNLLNWVVKESHMCKNMRGRMAVDQEAGWGLTAGNGGTGSKLRYLAGSRRSQGGTV